MRCGPARPAVTTPASSLRGNGTSWARRSGALAASLVSVSVAIDGESFVFFDGASRFRFPNAVGATGNGKREPPCERYRLLPRHV